MNRIDAIRNNNWGQGWETPKYIRGVVRSNKKFKQELLERIDKDISEGKNLERWIWGYVINVGATADMNISSVCYGVLPQVKNNMSYCLCEVVGGGVMWLNYENRQVCAGGSNEMRNEGIKMYNRLLRIRS
jgi:hypothetical protein